MKPGIQMLVRELRRAGKLAGIASQSPEEYMLHLIGHSYVDGQPLGDLFQERAIIGETKLRVIRNALQDGEDLHKPNPFSIYYAAGMIGRVEQQPILYFGDNYIDAESVREDTLVTCVIINERDYTTMAEELSSQENILVLKTAEEVRKP